LEFESSDSVMRHGNYHLHHFDRIWTKFCRNSKTLWEFRTHFPVVAPGTSFLTHELWVGRPEFSQKDATQQQENASDYTIKWNFCHPSVSSTKSWTAQPSRQSQQIHWKRTLLNRRLKQRRWVSGETTKICWGPWASGRNVAALLCVRRIVSFIIVWNSFVVVSESWRGLPFDQFEITQNSPFHAYQKFTNTLGVAAGSLLRMIARNEILGIC
jgi:hypothetical protein